MMAGTARPNPLHLLILATVQSWRDQLRETGLSGQVEHDDPLRLAPLVFVIAERVRLDRDADQPLFHTQARFHDWQKNAALSFFQSDLLLETCQEMVERRWLSFDLFKDVNYRVTFEGRRRLDAALESKPKPDAAAAFVWVGDAVVQEAIDRTIRMDALRRKAAFREFLIKFSIQRKDESNKVALSHIKFDRRYDVVDDFFEGKSGLRARPM